MAGLVTLHHEGGGDEYGRRYVNTGTRTAKASIAILLKLIKEPLQETLTKIVRSHEARGETKRENLQMGE